MRKLIAPAMSSLNITGENKEHFCESEYTSVGISGGSYGPVSVVRNHFAIGEACAASAVTFATDCRGIMKIDNKFSGRSAWIYEAPGSQSVNIQDNTGVAP